MSFENKGSTTAVAVVTAAPDRSGNFVIEAADDPAVIIETALAYLNTFGGGTLITKGAGQTWTFETSCDIPGNNITWLSDWSLTFTLANSVDDNVIDATGRDYLVFNGLRVDGNKAGQTTGAGAVSDCIRVRQCSHVKILNGWFYDGARYGIGAVGFGAIDVNIEIGGNYCDNNGWNGITSAFPATASSNSRVYVHDNYVAHSSDIGITSYSDYTVVSSNIVEDMDGTDGNGGGAGSWGCYAVEGDATRIPVGVVMDNNIARNSGAGVIFFRGRGNVFSNGYIEGMSVLAVHFQNDSVGCRLENTTIRECEQPIWVARNTTEDGKHIISGNDIYNETQVITAWDSLIVCRANGTIIRDNSIWSTTSQVNIYGVDLNGTNEDPMLDVEFVGNTIYGFDGENNIMVHVRNNVDGAIIKDNYFHDGATGVHIGAAADAGNMVLNNVFDNVTIPLVDNGTDTIMHVARGCFIKELGTAAWVVTAAAPMGIDIDAANEGALAKVVMPDGLHMVLRMKVHAISNVTEADAMRGQIACGSGIDNEAWNAEAIAVVDHPSVTTNFAANDKIHWMFDSGDDADIDDLVPGDLLQFCFYHEGAGGDDCETDILLCGDALEIHYV